MYWEDDLVRDRDAYLGIARNISAGKGFCSPETTTPTAFRPPVYPIVIGVLGLILPEPTAVATVNIVAGLATVWAVWVLVGLWWKPVFRQQLTAAIAIAADPLMLRYSAQSMTECLFTALTAWTVVGVTRIWKSSPGTVATAGLTGVVAGLAALCRPTLFPFLGLIWVAMFVFIPHDHVASRWQRWKPLLTFALCLSLVLATWAGRNFVVLGQPILTTTHGGYTLLLGNNPVFFEEVAKQPWGTVWQHESLVRWQASLAEAMQRDLGDLATEVDADEWYTRQATHAIHDDHDGFHDAVWYRIRSFWSLAPRGPEVTGTRFLPLLAMWYAGLFLLAGVGFLKAAVRRQPAAILGGLLIATVAGLHLVYWTDTRMRAPLHPVLITFAAGVFSRRDPRP